MNPIRTIRRSVALTLSFLVAALAAAAYAN